MDLAEDGSEDATSTPPKEEACCIPPTPTENGIGMTTTAPAEEQTGTIPPAPTKRDAITTPPAPTNEVAGRIPPALAGKASRTTPEERTVPKQKCTPKPHRPATPSGERNSSDDDHHTEDEEYVSRFLECLSLDPDWERMFDDVMRMIAHHGRNMGNKAVPFFQQAVNEDPKLCIEAGPQVTAGLSGMCEAIVRFDTRLGNISFFTSGEGKRNAGKDVGRRKQVCKE